MRIRDRLLVFGGTLTVAGHDGILAGDSGRFLGSVDRYVAGWRSSADPGGPQRDRACVFAHPQLVLAEGRHD